jgi:hypothetical protein
MSRGQMQQVFVYLTALIVIIASVWIGAKLIGALRPAACDASNVQFQKDLSNLLDTATVNGARGERVLRNPCGATQICFVDSRVLADDARSTFSGGAFATIDASVKSGVSTNVFLREEESTAAAAFDSRIILTGPGEAALNAPICIDASGGRFRFYTEGYGRYVLVYNAVSP